MKKLFALAVMALALAVSCDPLDNPKDPKENKLEVNEANLAGTWECYIEHDFAQGYAQKYRVQFSGREYTMWHMHQEVETINGNYGSLVNVGDKYSGTWEYTNGTLYFTHRKWFASSFISSMSPLSYTYYNYSTDTMESDPWFESSEGIVATLEKDEWDVKSLTSKALTVKINMDTFVLEKK